MEERRTAYITVDGNRVGSCLYPQNGKSLQAGTESYSSREVVPSHTVELSATPSGAKVEVRKIIRKFSKESSEPIGTLRIDLSGNKTPDEPISTGLFGWKIDIESDPS